MYLHLIRQEGIKDYKKYEYLYAIKLGLINWDHLPSDFDEKFNIPHKMDYGIDLVDINYTKACQVKKYEGSTITWKNFCTFVSYSLDVMNINKMILATTKTAKIDRLAKCTYLDSNKVDLMRIDYNDLMRECLDIKVKRQRKKRKIVIEERPYLFRRKIIYTFETFS